MAQVQSSNLVQIGTVIADTYEIVHLLGRGGMGTVWEATHARLPGKKVAIKVLHPEVAKDQESLARFKREAEIASRIGHPNIVDVHDFNQLGDGTPYLILEYLEGVSLEDRIDHGSMKLPEVISIARQIGSGLRAAHAEGVIHRDLKPQNIFLANTTDAAGNVAARARILDFGISKIRGSSTVQTQDSTILGTPQYMAPEQATGNHSAVDQRTDVFALGAILYEMLAGRPAFTGQTIPEVVFKVVYEEPTPLDQVSGAPPAIIHAIHKALAKKQEERFQSVEAFIEALSGTALSVAGAPVPAAVQSAAAQPDALASTVASGNYAPVTGVQGAGASNIGMAQTIDSGRMDSAAIGISQPPHHAAPAAGPHIAHTGPIATHAGVTGHGAPAPTGSSKGLKLALVLALLVGLGGAGVAIWTITRPPETTAQTDPTTESADPTEVNNTIETHNVPPPLALDAGVVLAPADASASTERTEETAAEKAARKKAAKEKAAKEKTAREKAAREKAAREKAAKDAADADTGVTTVTKTEFSGPDDPRKDLREAQKLIKKEPGKALFLIRRALGNGGRGSQFYVVQAKAHCMRRDITKVRATLNKLGKRAKTRVAAFCARNGFDID